MRYQRAVSAIVGATFVLACACAARAEDGAVLQRRYKQGDSDRYKIVLTFDGVALTGHESKADLGVMVLETVKSVGADGAGTLAWTAEYGQVRTSDDITDLAGTPLTFNAVCSPRAVSATAPQPQSVVEFRLAHLARLLQIVLPVIAPAQGLRVGDSAPIAYEVGARKEKWTGTVTMSPVEAEVSKAAPNVAKLHSTVQGVLWAQVFQSGAKAPDEESQNVRITMDSYIYADTGKLYKRAGQIVAGMPNGRDLTIAFTLVRAKRQPTAAAK